MARAPYLDPARFGVRVALSAVTTVLLVLVVRGSPRPAGLEARGGPPWPAPASVPAGVRAAGLTLLASLVRWC